MSNSDNHPIIVLVVATSLVTVIAGGVFGVWAKYDVIPSRQDNSYQRTNCNVESSEIVSTTESCACHDGGLSCTLEYPCIVIKVQVNSSKRGKSLMLYKDLTSFAFSSKCSFYPVGKLCRGNSNNTAARALYFKEQRGQVGSNITCYANDINDPQYVVAEGNKSDEVKFILFVLSVVVFFLPLAMVNCFFFYKWKLVASLGTSLKRHNRVASMPVSAAMETRRDTAFTTTQFETD